MMFYHFLSDVLSFSFMQIFQTNSDDYFFTEVSNYSLFSNYWFVIIIIFTDISENIIIWKWEFQKVFQIPMISFCQ